jgi:hypothetical protein
MVQEVRTQPSIFGRLGQGLGQGLAESIPKEVERNRLTSGLKNFQENMAGKSPLQLGTELVGIPGLTAEHLYTLSPLIRQQQIREAGGIKGQRTQTGETTPFVNPNPSAQPKPTGQPKSKTSSVSQTEHENKAAQNRTLKSIEATRAQLQPIIRKNDTELYNESAEMSRDNPIAFPTPQDALPIVTQNENTRIANLTENRNVGNAADVISSKLRTGIENRWGKDKSSGRIPDTVQSSLLSKAEHQLADPKNKLSEQHIIDKFGKIGDDIAEKDTVLEDRSKHGWLSGNYTPDKILSTINNSRGAYKEAGALREFGDIISEKFNLDAPGSAYLAFPPSNKKANQIVNSLQKLPVNQFGVRVSTSPKSAIQAADQLSNIFDTSENSEDSILSYAMALKQKNIDPDVFLKRLNQNKEAGLFVPNSRQTDELSKGFPLFPALGTIYLYSLMNKEKLVEE